MSTADEAPTVGLVVRSRRSGKTQALIDSLLAQANARGIRVQVIESVRPITDEQVEAAARIIDPDAWLLNPREYEEEYGGVKSRPGRVRSSIIKARAALEAARGAAL